MGRSTAGTTAQATTPAQCGGSALAATVRHLDDGGIALVVTGPDTHRLREATRTGGPLLVHVAADTAGAARAELARGLDALGDGPLSDAYASLLLAASLAAPGEARLALTAVLAAAEAAWAAGDRTACIAAIDAASTAVTAAADDCDHLRDHLQGLRALIEQDPERAVEPLRRVLAQADGDASPEELHRASVAALLLGDVETACEIGVRALASARADGLDDSRTLEYLAYAEMRAGRHARARTHAREGLRSALRRGRSNTAAHHRGVLALTASIEGDLDELAAQAELALAASRRHGLAQTGTLAEWALARADLGRGRPDAAASRLRALIRADGGHFALQPLILPCFIEAAMLSGSPEEALPAADDLERWTGFGIDRAAGAQLARCRALLAVDGPADDHYRLAIQLHTNDIGDFERARTLFLYGKWLRRRRRPRESRAVLRDALHAFERCGARGWAEQARGELRATGEPATGASQDTRRLLASLTPHQRRVALEVAKGSTNREVAQVLSVSIRTVDHHLRNIFAALGIRSRVELAALVARVPSSGHGPFTAALVSSGQAPSIP